MRKLMRQSRTYRAYEDGFSIIMGIIIIAALVWRLVDWIF